MTLIGLVVVLVIVGALLYVSQILPIDATVKRIIQVIVIIAVLLYVLSAFGLIPHGAIPLK